MNRWSSDDSEGKNEIPIGTSVCMGDSYPWGATAKVTRKASIKDIIAEGYEIEGIEAGGDEILYISIPFAVRCFLIYSRIKSETSSRVSPRVALASSSV